jgi:hypothetical protein
MSEQNGQSDLDAVLERMTPERKAEFLRLRLRLKDFHENDEVLAVASYMDTIVILIDRITGNLASLIRHSGPNGSNAPEPALVQEFRDIRPRLEECIQKLDSQRKQPSRPYYNLRPRWKTIGIAAAGGIALLAITAWIGFLVGANHAHKADFNGATKALWIGDGLGPWLASNGGYIAFYGIKESDGKVFHRLIVRGKEPVALGDAYVAKDGSAVVNIR